MNAEIARRLEFTTNANPWSAVVTMAVNAMRTDDRLPYSCTEVAELLEGCDTLLSTMIETAHAFNNQLRDTSVAFTIGLDHATPAHVEALLIEAEQENKLIALPVYANALDTAVSGTASGTGDGSVNILLAYDCDETPEGITVGILDPANAEIRSIPVQALHSALHWVKLLREPGMCDVLLYGEFSYAPYDTPPTQSIRMRGPTSILRSLTSRIGSPGTGTDTFPLAFNPTDDR